MYNQSNAITCLKCKVKFFKIYNYTYVPRNLNLSKTRQHLNSGFNLVLKISRLFNWVPMNIAKKMEPSGWKH